MRLAPSGTAATGSTPPEGPPAIMVDLTVLPTLFYATNSETDKTGVPDQSSHCRLCLILRRQQTNASGCGLPVRLHVKVLSSGTLLLRSDKHHIVQYKLEVLVSN